MSKHIFLRFSSIINQIERTILQLFGHGNPPGLCIAGTHAHPLESQLAAPKTKFSLKDLIGDGYLWAVPKHRRTVEKRLNRKFGNPYYVWKLLVSKSYLRVCNQCGHNHEAGVLCPYCYSKVRAETNQMQEKIQEQLGLNPIEEEVIVLYEGEKKEQSSEFFNGKRIIEMKKPRPIWFSNNLLQKTTQQPAITKDIKPNELA